MILVTGGCGYLGSHCAVELLNNGYEIIILDNFSNSEKRIHKQIENIANKKVKLEECDIRDRKKLDQVFLNNKVESVFHFAGLKSISESFDKPEDYYSVNIIGTVVLLELMVKYCVSKIIFSSSATIYGDYSKLPWHEKIDLNIPDSPYAQSKIIIEKLLKNFSLKHNFLKVAILRYFNPVGFHHSGLIRENSKNSTNLFPEIIKYLNNEKPHINIYGNDFDTHDGYGVRDYIHVNDLINGHIEALNFILKHDKTYNYNVWNLGSGKGRSVLEIVNAFEKQLKRKLKCVIKPRRKGDLGQYWADINKAKRELGWHPKKTLHEIVEDSLMSLKE
ncbi:UDP-glucose 4-epimerase GalE [Pelagibacterales bacterium SAG-MED32]|nr:UDP-glucose 4-epimerase GalE [Pelagibacterales bacterium SAG-MED32]